MRRDAGTRTASTAALRPVARAAAIGLLLLGIVAMHQVPLPHGGDIAADSGAVHASASDQRGGHHGLSGDSGLSRDHGNHGNHGDSGGGHRFLAHLCLAIVALGLGLLSLWRRPIRVRRPALVRTRDSGVGATRAPPPAPPDLHALQILRL